MSQKELNQTGFTLVEGLLIVIALALVVFTGYYVWHTQHQTNKTLDTAIRSSEGNSSSTPTGKKFQFKELGVQFVLPSSLKGLTYNVQQVTEEDGGMVDGAYLGDPSLTDLLNKCAGPNSNDPSGQAPNFAAIERQPGKFDSSKLVESQLLKQFKDFNINISFPNGAICGSDDNNLNQQWFSALHKSQKTFVDAFKATATPIK